MSLSNLQHQKQWWKSLCNLFQGHRLNRRPQFDSWVRKICWRRDRLPTPAYLGFPCGSAGRESSCNAGDLRSIPELGRSPGEGKGYPLQYSGLENSMDSIVHGVAKNWTWQSNFHFQLTISNIEKKNKEEKICPKIFIEFFVWQKVEISQLYCKVSIGKTENGSLY